MNYFYTARARFDKNHDADGSTWTNYITWSRLTQLIELVSVDKTLNEMLIEPDQNSQEFWNELVVENSYGTGFFRTPAYVLATIDKKIRFNFLAVIINPQSDCALLQ